MTFYSFMPFKPFLKTATGKISSPKRYRFEDAIRDLSHILVRNPRLDTLIEGLLGYLGEVLGTEQKAAFLQSEIPGKFVMHDASRFGGRDSILTDFSPLIRYFISPSPPEMAHSKEILDRDELARECARLRMPPEPRRHKEALVRELNRLGVVLAVPIFSKEKLLGLLLLGEKRSRKPFSRGDLRFLDVVSHEAASFIENALNFERILRLDEIQSEFITVVSHQLRTPLSISRWNFELLLGGTFGKLEPKVQEVIRYIYHALLTLTQGMNNFMIAIEIETKQIFARLQEVEFSPDIIEEVVAQFQEIIKQKNIRIEKEFLFSGRASIDLSKIQKVIEVFLDNAIRYSPDSSTIRIRTERREEGELAELMVSCEDQGIGVPPKNRALVFNRFFRGEEAKKISPSGYGLGLYVAKAYVEMHGGKAWVEGKDGKGSIFRFTVPLKSP